MAPWTIKVTLTEVTPTENAPSGEEVTTVHKFKTIFEALAFIDQSAVNWTVFKKVTIEPVDGREFF